MTETRRQTGWRTRGLTLSIVLNLFLVAVIGGHLLRQPAPPPQGDTILARALANAKATLSPADADAFGKVLLRDAPSHADAAQQLEQARAKLGQSIVAAPFDRQAVQDAFVAWQGAWNHFFNDAGQTIIDALATVSPEGREKLVEQRRQATMGSMKP